MNRLRVILLGLVLLMGLSLPAQAAEEELVATITSVRPTVLTSDTEEVVLRARLLNNTKRTWTNITPYFVIPSNPFRSRLDVAALFSDIDNAYGGTRNDLPSRRVTVSSLLPGQSVEFTITVPYADLRIDGNDGIYPVGVHVLATDAQGSRNPDGVARAYTLLPKIETEASIATSIIWPFVSPAYRMPGGTYANTEELLQSISSNGQLRHYLNAARTNGDVATSVVIDPALLSALTFIASNRVGPPSSTATGSFTSGEQQLAEGFLNDLLAFARSNSTWILGYARPDIAAVNDDSKQSRTILDAIFESTKLSMDEYGLVSRMVTWPASGLASDDTFAASRFDGATPMIASANSLPSWEPRYGSIVNAQTDAGPLPVVIDDPAFSPLRNDSLEAVRQKVLARAALAVIDRRINSTSQADVAFVMNPRWDPVDPGSIYSVFSLDWIAASTAERMLVSQPSVYEGQIGAAKKPESLSDEHTDIVGAIMSSAELRGSIGPASDRPYFSHYVPEALGTRWITDADEGFAHAQALADELRAQLQNIEIVSPKQVTLSGQTGQFPLTISNGLSAQINVSLRLRSTSERVTLPEPQMLTIDSGQRTTLTIDVDLADRAGSTVVAELATLDGEPIGRATTVNVRSSAVGAVIWIGMAGAGLLVIAAVIRRLSNKKQNDRT